MSTSSTTTPGTSARSSAPARAPGASPSLTLFTSGHWAASWPGWLSAPGDTGEYTGKSSDNRATNQNYSRFRLTQDSRTPGLTSSSRNSRKKRNLVSTKFNMINWLLETLCTFLVVIDINRFFTILYILIMSCSTPLVYYLGIEENRTLAQAQILKRDLNRRKRVILLRRGLGQT